MLSVTNGRYSHPPAFFETAARSPRKPLEARIFSRLPYPDELLKEAVQELGVTQHTQGVARGRRVDDDAVEFDAQLVVPLYQFQDLTVRFTERRGNSRKRGESRGERSDPVETDDGTDHTTENGEEPKQHTFITKEYLRSGVCS